MTRVNAGIKPHELTDQHLMAEYREILRCNHVAINGYKKDGEKYLKQVPSEFTLNKGHMKFFANKLEFIMKRFESLKDELVNRKWDVKMNYSKPEDMPESLWGDYNPTKEARDILIERILLRFPKKATYYGKNISLDEYKEEVLSC